MEGTNQAAWLMKAKDTHMVVNDAPYPKAQAGEVVIQTQAIAINPADFKLQRLGILISRYPAILGCDVAGSIVEVGDDLKSAFNLGDRVVGPTSPLEDYKYAAFQKYVVLKAPCIAKVPTTMKLSDAVVLPLGLNTALSCLFDKASLSLEAPPSKAGYGKSLLIWGASGSVGCCAVQLAVSAGYEVFGIASSHNHAMLKSIGAAQCFDYHDPNLFDTVTAALHGKDVVGALDAVSSKETLHTLCEILYKLKCRPIISSVRPGAETDSELGITIKSNMASTVASSGLAQHVWQRFLEPGLSAGTIQCKPDAEVTGHGLQEIQAAVDRLADGVSAKKLVVTL